MTDDLVKQLRRMCFLFQSRNMGEVASKIEDSIDRIEQLEAALRFYAEPWKHVDQIPDFYSELNFAETARAALEKKDD